MSRNCLRWIATGVLLYTAAQGSGTTRAQDEFEISAKEDTASGDESEWNPVIPAGAETAMSPVAARASEQEPLPELDAAPSPDVAAIQIPIDELKLLIKPLTKDEMKAEAEGWIELLQNKVTEISSNQIQARQAEGHEKRQLLERINDLNQHRAAIVERTNVVLDGLANRGGEDADFRKYVAAVSGIAVDVKDTHAIWTAATGWLKSPEGGMRWGTNVLLFVVTLLAFQILASLAGSITSRGISTFRNTSELLRDFFVNCARRGVLFIGVVVALSMLQVNIGPFLAAIGAVGFVVGFALQGTLSNFASGIMILLYRPYDIGDVVTVAGTTGKVDSMSLVSTTLRTPDNQNVVVPNSSIWGGIITNITGNPTRRVDMVFGISYGDDATKATRILQDILAQHALVLDEPEPVVKLHELGDSSVNFICRPWAKTSDYWAVYWDVTRQVKERFDREGISIPFPQREVHVHTTAARTLGEAA